ncbi:MAG: hypothetical protein QXI33_00540 [Candidatus Pacearchaeota archaeon]
MAFAENIFMSDFAVYIIYPFLLIFTLIFAILEKSKILGEDKRQINAMVSLSIALIFVSFSWATGIIVDLIPFLAVSVVVLLVFMVLFGFVSSTKEEGLKLPGWLIWSFFVLIVLFIVIVLLVITGQWDYVYGSLFIGGQPTNLMSNIFLLFIIGAALVVVFLSGKKSK